MAVKVWVLDSLGQLESQVLLFVAVRPSASQVTVVIPILLPPYEWEIMSTFQGCCELEVKYVVALYGLALSQW